MRITGGLSESPYFFAHFPGFHLQRWDDFTIFATDEGLPLEQQTIFVKINANM